VYFGNGKEAINRNGERTMVKELTMEKSGFWVIYGGATGKTSNNLRYE
jgi:hypothetical protein